MALDEATTAFLAEAAKAGQPPLHEMTVAEARAMNAGLNELFGEGPEIASVRDVRVSTADGETFPVRIFQPDNSKGVLVYYHGGGWVLGTLSGFDTLCRQFADRTGMTVVLAEYRKAPESPFPAAVQDAWAALEWADTRRGELAGEAAPLVVAGDSAGGNLAAVVAQRAARQNGPEIAFQVLVYPVIAADFENETYTDPENALMLTRESMMMFWDLYAPEVKDRSHSDASPLEGDATGTPPALVVLAEHDVLRAEGHLYVQKLRDSGVPVEEHVVPGQMHGFFTFPNVLPGAATGMDIVVEALAKVTG